MNNKLDGLFDGIKGLNFSMPKMELPSFEFPAMELPEIEHPAHATNELLEKSLELAKEQINLLSESLKQANKNYVILKEHYDLQVKANKENEKELVKSKRFNRWSLAIAIISLASSIIIGILALL